MREIISKIKRIINEKVLCMKVRIQEHVDILVEKSMKTNEVVAKEAGLSGIVIAALLILVGIVLIFVFKEEIEELIRSLFDIIDQKKESMFQNV